MMDRLRRATLITRLLQNLQEKGSWCGETYVQKAVFFAQRLMKIPLEFDFILYKHGPFSFDLRDELTSLRADGLVQLVPRWPYGPTIMSTDLADRLQDIYGNTLNRYKDRIAYVADKLGSKGVSHLARLATVLYLAQQQGAGEPQCVALGLNERANKLSNLKPHISVDQAIAAIQEVDQIIAEVQKSYKENK